MRNLPKVHFMGIGGSGLSAVAGIAHEYGYEVDGCDVDIDSPYIFKLKNKVSIKKGHSPDHLVNRDLLVVSPAVYFKYPPESEIVGFANKLTWQEFLGKYLQQDKEVIAVSGTHGKSTTSAFLALVFEKAGFYPSAMVGAKLYEWGENYKAGKGKIFVTEADEFYDNFLNYSPEAIILNNIEFDHPDYFSSIRKVIESFKKHVLSLRGKKILVFNNNSPGVRKLLKGVNFMHEGIRAYSYSVGKNSADFRAFITGRSSKGTSFVVHWKGFNDKEEFFTNLCGDYNISNIMGVIALSTIYGIKPSIIRKVLDSFIGISRRLELLGEKRGIFVYDDYAHHPTAIKKTISALKQKHPMSRLYVVVEPHSFSRVKRLLKGYAQAFRDAYCVVIAPIFKGRDKEDYGMSEEKLAKVVVNDRVWYSYDFKEIAARLAKELKKHDVVVVMGAGKSSELARVIFKSI